MPQGRLRRCQPRADLPGRGIPTTRADGEHREPGVDLRGVGAAHERAPQQIAPVCILAPLDRDPAQQQLRRRIF